MSQIVVQGEQALLNKIIIEPELPIGTEFWIMFDNKPKLGLISGYKVWVSALPKRPSYFKYRLSC